MRLQQEAYRRAFYKVRQTYKQALDEWWQERQEERYGLNKGSIVIKVEVEVERTWTVIEGSEYGGDGQ